MAEVLELLGVTWPQLAAAAAGAIAIYAVVIVAARVVGLRSFAKMSAFDFAMTVAIGSIIASTATGNTPLVAGIVAVALLFIGQYLVARVRRGGVLGGLVDNTPLLLMYRGEPLEDHLRLARVTHDDLRAKLREANVLRYEDVVAVVFETTGDVTVLHGGGTFDPALLDGVRCGPIDPRRPGR